MLMMSLSFCGCVFCVVYIGVLVALLLCLFFYSSCLSRVICAMFVLHISLSGYWFSLFLCHMFVLLSFVGFCLGIAFCPCFGFVMLPSLFRVCILFVLDCFRDFDCFFVQSFIRFAPGCFGPFLFLLLCLLL